ncbi:MAG TPA: type II toxin-antitoxin system HicA family toxin [Gemmatimonadales bacterium]|nr:type II toxin-antitoxin system HicA family toxin [Gemmatimonadales bacterium]
MAALSRRHLCILEQVFEHPTRADLEREEATALLRALGAELSEGRGSRLRVHLGGVRAVFHRPHPGKELRKYAVEDLRDYLKRTGITP